MKLIYFKVPYATWSLQSVLAGSILLASNAHASTEITPIITVSEFFVDNKTATLNETGQVTRISPGITVDYAQARLNLVFDYRLNAVINSGLQGDDHENQSLNFLTEINHIPNHWDTLINARVEQVNTSPDGIQIVNPINDSSNTSELRTLGISTAYQAGLTGEIDYQTGIEVDFADVENQDNTDSIGLSLGINNNRTLSKLRWNVDIDSRRSGTSEGGIDQDDEIDTLQAGLNYRINKKFSTFLAVEKNDTNNDNLNETSTTLGISWFPSANNFITVGAGVRGDETTYSLDSVIRNNRLSFAVNYVEEVTTSRSLVLEELELDPGLVSSSQPLSITPELLKKGTVSLTITGRRTDITLAYFNESRNRQDTDSEEQQTEEVSLSAKRTLSRLSSVQLSISNQDSQADQQNTIKDITLSYERQLSRKFILLVELRKTEQQSDVVENEYEQSLLGFTLTATF